ncbi:uncharacterized protein LOC124154385 isoform X1 [Ischnura elegans]|uniref:uncharacterized protein LOC124154385 isoform X1 n=1 Tax=Ischnura elegans TaxID=197161 RepID=UPI001ED87604|nr:uncharacterized protein LOC124154385 isoform X1 [Ischnura elegans]
MNKTRSIYGSPRCLLCKHTCRLQHEISNCVMTGLIAMQNVSTKSQHMVPLLKSMLEITMTSLCENDGQIMDVDDEEDAQCSLRAWTECKSKFDFLDNLDRVAFCDSADPSTDPYPDGYVCKEVVDFFDCADRETESCSEKVRSSLAHLKSKTSSWESCTKYF